MTTQDTPGTHDDVLDGNALAGALGELFAVDATTVVGRCAGCGSVAPIGVAVAYLHGPGAIARCRGCAAVLLRLVRGPDRAWLDLRGVAYLEVALPLA